jgi:hypothetical protein
MRGDWKEINKVEWHSVGLDLEPADRSASVCS